MLGKLIGGGIFDTIAKLGSEWIDTDKESAEAKAVMVKALDPNGAMRVRITTTICSLYTVYIALAVMLIMAQALNLGPAIMVAGEQVRSVDMAMDSIKELFMPITTLFGAITSASFGVNVMNVNAERKK